MKKTHIRNILALVLFMPALYCISILAQVLTAPYTTGGALSGFGFIAFMVIFFFIGPVFLLGLFAIAFLYSSLACGAIGRLFSGFSWIICVFFYVYYCTYFQFLTATQRSHLYSHPTLGNAALLILTAYFFFNTTLCSSINLKEQFTAALISHAIGFALVRFFLT